MSDYLNSFRSRNKENFDSPDIDHRHLELSALIELSQTLNTNLELDAILDNLILVPMGRMMIGRGLVLLKKNDHYILTTTKGIVVDKKEQKITFKEVPEQIKRIDDNKDLPDFFPSNNLKIIVPIRSSRNVIGFMCFGKKLLGTDYSEDELHFLSSLGNIAAPAIENAQAFEEISSLNRQLDHKIQELNTLFEIGKELNRLFEPQEILKRLSFSLMGQMFINQFFVVLKNGKKLNVVYRKGSSFNESNIQKCLNQCEHITDITEPVLMNNSNPNFAKMAELNIYVIVPMSIQDETRGYIFIGPKINKAEFSQSELDFLSTLANIAMISIENARLFEETVEKKRLEEELNLAKNIQQRLLPDNMPEINNYDIHGLNIPSKSVGGDYFDIIKLSDNEYLIIIADVSGKGMPASLLMSNLQAGIHTLKNENYDLAEITFRLNNLIHQNTTIEKYITFFISKIYLDKNKLEFVNAGHNPPYLFNQDGSSKTLETGGIILGMMAGYKYEIGTLNLEPGCRLFMFTDGVTEAMSAEDEPFEEYRVEEFFKILSPKLSSKEINEKMIETLYDFAGDPTEDDDITMLTIQRKN